MCCAFALPLCALFRNTSCRWHRKHWRHPVVRARDARTHQQRFHGTHLHRWVPLALLSSYPFVTLRLLYLVCMFGLIFSDFSFARQSTFSYQRMRYLYVFRLLTLAGVGGSSSGGLAVAGILKYMGDYPDPIASQGDIYYHRLVEAYNHVFAVSPPHPNMTHNTSLSTMACFNHKK